MKSKQPTSHSDAPEEQFLPWEDQDPDEACTAEECEDFPEPFPYGKEDAEIFDLLENLLNHIHKSRDHRPLMHALRSQMGSAYTMFHAKPFFLERMGMNHLDAFFFGNFLDLLRGAEIAYYGEHPRIARLSEAKAYIAANFLNLDIERFYLFCVNKHGKLKARILLNEGIEDRALLSINMLVCHILRERPLAVIVAHNHPNGTLMPSRNDIQCTANIIHALLALGVPLLDHVIVANNTVVSIRENGFIPEQEWRMQVENNFLLRDWFLPPLQPKPRKYKPRTPEEERKRVERELRFSRSRRLRKMEKAMRMYRHHSKNAKKCMDVYQLLSAKDERLQQEEMQQKIRMKIETYLQKYETAYQLWQEQEARNKQNRRSKGRSKPTETNPQD